MRRNLLLALVMVLAQTVCAQTIEPNMKWGKPTDQELTMTEYPDDKDADAVVLFNKLDVYYGFIDGSFKVYYVHKTRAKVLKPEGKHVADRSIVIQDNASNGATKEVVTGLKAVAYNIEDGKVVKTKMERTMVNEERLDKYQKQIKFSVPQVKVGTVIEYEYHIESDYFYNLRDWYAQSSIPVLYTSYELAIPEWFEFNIEETGMNHLEKKMSETPLTLQKSRLSLVAICQPLRATTICGAPTTTATRLPPNLQAYIFLVLYTRTTPPHGTILISN